MFSMQQQISKLQIFFFFKNISSISYVVHAGFADRLIATIYYNSHVPRVHFSLCKLIQSFVLILSRQCQNTECDLQLSSDLIVAAPLFVHAQACTLPVALQMLKITRKHLKITVKSKLRSKVSYPSRLVPFLARLASLEKQPHAKQELFCRIFSQPSLVMRVSPFAITFTR